MIPASVEEMCMQAKMVLDYYTDQVNNHQSPQAEKIHFNWMAKGEPLLNKTLIQEWDRLSTSLRFLGALAGITMCKFKISTIMPEGLDTWFALNPTDIIPEIYYSIYSIRASFRKRWLPKAMTPTEAASFLKIHHEQLNGRIVIHHSLILDENDSDVDAMDVGYWAQVHGLDHAKFNLVRYNPYSPLQGREPSEENIRRYFDLVTTYFIGANSRIIPRVGRDVTASCGMFFGGKDNINEKVWQLRQEQS